jgi:hypothetical protein
VLARFGRDRRPSRGQTGEDVDAHIIIVDALLYDGCLSRCSGSLVVNASVLVRVGYSRLASSLPIASDGHHGATRLQPLHATSIVVQRDINHR